MARRCTASRGLAWLECNESRLFHVLFAALNVITLSDIHGDPRKILAAALLGNQEKEAQNPKNQASRNPKS